MFGDEICVVVVCVFLVRIVVVVFLLVTLKKPDLKIQKYTLRWAILWREKMMRYNASTFGIVSIKKFPVRFL